MKTILLGIMLWFAASFAWAQSSHEDVISAQVEAMRVDDFGLAFSYAAPGIQGVFGSAENFQRMILQGYPMVHDPASFVFGKVAEADGFTYQAVTFRDARGVGTALLYEMVFLDGVWRINGVQLLPAPDVAV